MELDNIKDIWENEQISETPNVSLEKQKEIRMPLEKIRKNMRMEFWATIIGLIIISISSPLLIRIVNNAKFVTYFVAFLLSFILIISFYFLKFFKLYKDLEKMDLNTRESLKDLMWKFKLNEQYYLSYYLASVPVLVFGYTLIMDYVPGYREMTGFKFIYSFLFFTLISLFFLYHFGKFWFRSYYGKYIYKIKKTVDFLNLLK